jgi:hypothetical protein
VGRQTVHISVGKSNDGQLGWDRVGSLFNALSVTGLYSIDDRVISK